MERSSPACRAVVPTVEQTLIDCLQPPHGVTSRANLSIAEGSFMVGTTISHYKVLEKNGEGGMGEAFHGFNPLRTLRLSIAFTTASKPREEP